MSDIPIDLGDKLERLVRELVGQHLVSAVDHLALYPAEVKACASDGSTVDVTPLNPAIEPHQGVPLRVMPPGTVAVVKPGAVVHLGWEEGDESKPYALAFRAVAGVKSLALNADALALNGTAYHTPKFDTFETDLSDLLTTLSTQLALGTSGTPAVQQLVGLAAIQAKITAIVTKLGNGTYHSATVTNG